MLEFGYFYELLPPCFSSRELAQHSAEVFQILGKKKFVTSPLLFSTRKSDNARRTIALPNPWSFLGTVHTFASNLTKCMQLTESTHSQSPITFIEYYDDFLEERTETVRLNSAPLREHLGARSSFVNNLKERLAAALGHPYKLTIDLASFYDSIYTHALTWSLCGKEPAKRWHTLIENREQNQHPEEKPSEYDIADQFDSAIRRQKNNETSGIVTGPFTSRIFSEMLLCGIDKQLENNTLLSTKHIAFKRYVDDYSFYLRSAEEADGTLALIEQIFHEFGLSVNHDKVSVERYPFDTLKDLRRSFREAFEADGIFGVLNRASIFTSEGEKGAYKYALKWLRQKKIEDDLSDTELSMLINIGVAYPNCAVLALNRIQEHGIATSSEDLANAVNLAISKALKSSCDQEALSGLYYCIELDLDIDAANIEEAITNGNDLCKIVALDYVRHRNGKIAQYEYYASDIHRAIDGLSCSLANVTTDSQHWLLLYESLNHGLMAATLGDGVTSEPMRQLGELGISFYRGFTHPIFEWAKASEA